MGEGTACTACGNDLPVDAKFCGRCGTPVGADAGAVPPSPLPPPPAPPPATKRSPRLALILVGVGVIAVLVVLGAVVLSGGDGDGGGDEAASPAPTRPTQPASAPIFNEGDTLAIEVAGRVERFPEDCVPPGPGVPGTCDEPTPGTEFFQVTLRVIDEGDFIVPSLQDRLFTVAEDVTLEHSDGEVVTTKSTTVGSFEGPEALTLLFEVPPEASDFLLIWPGTDPIDLSDVES